MSPYDSIKNIERYRLQEHRPMSIQSRASQFAPFAALTGFDEEIDETARKTDTKRDLTEDELEILNACLCELMEREAERPRVTVVYFQADMVKSGGAYCTYTGNLRFFDEAHMVLKFVDDSRIRIADIMRIEILS